MTNVLIDKVPSLDATLGLIGSACPNCGVRVRGFGDVSPSTVEFVCGSGHSFSCEVDTVSEDPSLTAFELVNTMNAYVQRVAGLTQQGGVRYDALVGRPRQKAQVLRLARERVDYESLAEQGHLLLARFQLVAELSARRHELDDIPVVKNVRAAAYAAELIASYQP